MTFKHVVLALPVVVLGLFTFGTIVVSQSSARAETVRAELEKHEGEEQQARADTTSAVRETQADVRSLYRYMATGRPQPQLDKPVPTEPIAGDGGP